MAVMFAVPLTLRVAPCKVCVSLLTTVEYVVGLSMYAIVGTVILIVAYLLI